MNRKMIGEAIYIRVSDRKYNPISTKRGNVSTLSCSGKSAVFRMQSSLTSHGSSREKKPSDGRGILDQPYVCRCDLCTENTTIEELQVLFHALSDHEIRNNCFINDESISSQRIEAWWIILFVNLCQIIVEIGPNYSIICNLDRQGYGV